jgi:hypothetical protein
MGTVRGIAGDEMAAVRVQVRKLCRRHHESSLGRAGPLVDGFCETSAFRQPWDSHAVDCQSFAV